MSAITTANATSQRATPQGGILEGANPTHYNKKEPIIIFIIQAGIIIIFCRALHWPLAKLRQPRVIAEVIGGILLGPSVMGRIPGFTETIFPTPSMPNLSLVANLGLVLFLFLVGLEVDLRFLVSNWKIALSVGLAGMALPFALGAGISYGLYHDFASEKEVVPTEFGVFVLFIGVAMAITAFPVLCRILTELNLLTTSVGIIVLSAGVGNDVVGWILLALCVALVNAGTGLTALWVLLVCLGYSLFLAYAIRPAFMWFLRRTRALQDGPSEFVIVVTLLLTLASAFFTGIIGVHPIFGAFMVGLICPHEGGFAIKVTEKIEDIVSALFLPLYFTLSGLNTNLGLLDSGLTWAYVVGVIAVAFFGKFTGAALAARSCGLVWRESFTIGSLMSCKGLVELIVLNIGLQAKILSQRTFTIFVVMALITTFITTPLTTWLYPPWYQKKLDAWKRGEIDWDTGAAITSAVKDDDSDGLVYEKLEAFKIQRILVYLRLDNMSALLPFVSLFGGQPTFGKKRVHPLKLAPIAEDEKAPLLQRPIRAHGVRLLELTERTSTVMKVSELDQFDQHDPVINTFRTFGYLNNLAISGEVDVAPESSFSEILVSRAGDNASDLIILPWSETGSMSELTAISDDAVQNKLSADTYSAFVSTVLDSSPCNAAVFINNGFGGSALFERRERSQRLSAHSIRTSVDDIPTTAPSASRSHHIFLPFFGGTDDRAALRLVLQLAEHPDVTATIVHFKVPDGELDQPSSSSGVSSPPDTPAAKKQAVATTVCIPTSERDAAFFASLRHRIPVDLAERVAFESDTTSTPLGSAIERARSELGTKARRAGDLIVAGRSTDNSGFLSREGCAKINANLEAQRCLGVLAETVVRDEGLKASVLVVQRSSGSGHVFE